MEKEKIESVEHLNVYEVKYDGKVKRYEISADDGYSFYRKSEDHVESGMMMFPAKWGLENILSDIEVREN